MLECGALSRLAELRGTLRLTTIENSSAPGVLRPAEPPAGTLPWTPLRAGQTHRPPAKRHYVVKNSW